MADFGGCVPGKMAILSASESIGQLSVCQETVVFRDRFTGTHGDTLCYVSKYSLRRYYRNTVEF